MRLFIHTPGAGLRSRSGFTLIEMMVSSVCTLIIMAGVMAFIKLGMLSFSGITVQSTINQQAGYAIEFVQSRARLATIIFTNDSAGNILTLGFDDDPLTDSDGDGKPYNDKNHFERFQFIGINSTNATACSSNRLAYFPDISVASSNVLVPMGVRNLPRTNIFTIVNNNTVIINFGIVDSPTLDRYQAIDIQAAAVPLNRPAANATYAILP